MSNLSDILEINISRETAAVAREAFNIPLFLAAHTSFSDRTREYSTVKEVGEDFRSTSNVYRAAQRLFGQTRKPPKIVIGRKQVDSVSGSVATVSANTVYSLTISDTVVSITSDSTPSAIEIIAALRSQFASSSIVGVSMTDNLNGTFTIGVSTPGAAWSVKASSNLTLANYASSETWSEALDAVESENDDWYALTLESHLEEDIYEIANAIEPRNKIYGTSTSNSNVLSPSSEDDIASTLKNLGVQRTFLLYSGNADAEYPECAWIGSELPEQPGSNTWMFKGFALVTRDKLSTSQATAAKNKNANTYRTRGGGNMVSNGVMAGGEFIDTIIFCDWLRSRIEERIFFRLRNMKKVPFTGPGTTMIQSDVYAVLQEGINVGGLSDNPKPKVFIPAVTNISPNVKTLRRLEDVSFRATLAGAIHFVGIAGTVSA